MDYHHTLSEGTILDNEYRIIRALGSGGFANTYLAFDQSLHREVAIKEYFPNEIAYREGATTVRVKGTNYQDSFKWGLDRFKREAITLAKFRHANIVRVFNIFDANETAYIVLDFVKGADMEVWLKGLKRRPSQAELDALAGPLLNALDLVHGEGILHRDIKPQNIYIRDEDGVPVLLDFGAARFSVGELTGTTAAIVSRGYSPHEAYATDAKLQGAWTDIYGLAATFYRALSGNSPLESTERVLDDSMVPATALPGASDYRRQFLEAVTWGLAVLPKSRPRTANEWRTKLLSSSPLEALTTGPASSPLAPGVTLPPGMPPLSDSKSGASRPSGVPSRASSKAVKSESKKVPSKVASERHTPQKSGRSGFMLGGGMMVAGLATMGLWLSGMLESGTLREEPGVSDSVAEKRGGQDATSEEAPSADGATQDNAEQDRRRELKAEEERQAAAKIEEDRAARAEAADRELKAAERERLATEQKEEETRRVQSEERVRLAELNQQRERDAAEKATLDAKREARVEPSPQPPASAEPATPAVLDDSGRAKFVSDVQELLSQRGCYSGAINGDHSDTSTAIDNLKSALQRDGKSFRVLQVAQATRSDFESWLDWLRDDIRGFGCKPPAEPERRAPDADETPSKPRASPPPRREPSPPPKKRPAPQQTTPKPRPPSTPKPTRSAPPMKENKGVFGPSR